jgi:hypothetical protein
MCWANCCGVSGSRSWSTTEPVTKSFVTRGAYPATRSDTLALGSDAVKKRSTFAS